MHNQEKRFRELVEQQKANIYSVCYMLAASRQDADDMFQEVLVNLWKGMPKFRGESSVSTWTYRIALNTCISFRRKADRRPATTDINPALLCEGSELGDQTARLHRRIRHLEPFDRAIVLLWLEDLPYEEIGAIVGIPAKAVGVRLVRIREKLKKVAD